MGAPALHTKPAPPPRLPRVCPRSVHEAVPPRVCVPSVLIGPPPAVRAGPVFGVLPHCVEKKRKRETEVRQSGGGARRGSLCGGVLEMSCGRAVVRVVFW